MNELKKLIPAYLQATKVIVEFCMYAIPASDLQNGRNKGFAQKKKIKIAKKKKINKNNKRLNK